MFMEKKRVKATYLSCTVKHMPDGSFRGVVKVKGTSETQFKDHEYECPGIFITKDDALTKASTYADENYLQEK
jgi:hypothetical protein